MRADGPGVIRVINPNSNAAVTAGICHALEPLRFPGGPEILCETLEEGPFGIQTQRDVDVVAAPLADLVGRKRDADAFVIACYSDPGVYACREATDVPVLGIQECGVLAALARVERFGVIALSGASIERHMRRLRALGLESRLAGERPANLSVAESGDDFAALLRTGRELRDLDGAGAVILGCAGMARLRPELERELELPVIDPTQAAVVQAIGILRTV